MRQLLACSPNHARTCTSKPQRLCGKWLASIPVAHSVRLRSEVKRFHDTSLKLTCRAYDLVEFNRRGRSSQLPWLASLQLKPALS